MLKFFLILGIAIYIVYKVGSFLFKIGAASQQFKNNQHPGNINGKGQDGKGKNKTNLNGGEYIDYEEVK